MSKFKASKESQKALDKLTRQYDKEKTIQFNYIFENILERLKAEKKLDKILDMPTSLIK